jgi:RNA polymerase-interacting CarD/CdnL/TRCF family regulator
MSGDMKCLQLVLGLGGSHVIIPVHGIGSIKTTRGQITRRKICFYYTCKFSVISIKYVIKRKGIVLICLALCLQMTELHMRYKFHPMNPNKKLTFSKPILFID